MHYLSELRKTIDLPNRVGFKLIAIYQDGKEVVQEVKKDENGLHYIDNYNDVIGWLPKM